MPQTTRVLLLTIFILLWSSDASSSRITWHVTKLKPSQVGGWTGQMASTVTESQSNRACLVRGGTGDSFQGCRAGKSAITVTPTCQDEQNSQRNVSSTLLKNKKMVSCNIKNWFKKILISICLELDQFLLRSLRCILHVRAIRFRSESKNELIKVLAICKPFYILIETTMNYYYQLNEMESMWLGYQKRNGHHDSALAGSIVSHQMVSYTNQPEEACHCLHIRSHDFWQENWVYHFIFVTY